MVEGDRQVEVRVICENRCQHLWYASECTVRALLHGRFVLMASPEVQEVLARRGGVARFQGILRGCSERDARRCEAHVPRAST